jgi:hypothetical protein
MDEHGPAVRQPRRARHIDHFRRDRSKTGAAAGRDPDAGGVARDTREPETIRGNAAAARASLQKPRFTSVGTSYTFGPESSLAVKMIRVSSGENERCEYSRSPFVNRNAAPPICWIQIPPHTGPAVQHVLPRRCVVKKLFAVLSSVALLTGTGVAGQSKRESLQGVWQAVEVTLTGPGARTIAIPEPRPNLTIITARHYSRVEDQSERPRPIPADATKASADEVAGGVGAIRGRSRHV